MKKLMSVILLIAVLVSLCACAKKEEAAGVPAATLDPESPQAMFGHIDQTQKQNGVYQIWNAEGVQNFLKNPGEKFELLCDVDMQGAVVAPVGEFTGEFDGANFTISNFTVQGGDEKDFGLICVNKGDVSNLYLENVTFVPGENARNIGSLVGRNEGSLLRCNVGGTMEIAKAPEGANCGNLAGLNTGKIRNTNTTVDLQVTTAGKANVGGIAGQMTGGTVEFCEAGGKIDVTDSQVKSVGLFAGNATDIVITGCMFTGASNTLDGKLFTNFTGNAEDDELAVALDALWRDNDREPLTENQQKLRQIVVDEMIDMCSIEWHLHQDLLHDCTCTLTVCHGVYNNTYTYYGVPYNHKGGSLNRMRYALDEEGYIKDWLYDMDAFDGFDLYIGNDCSTAVGQAWWKVSNTCDFSRVTYMIPQKTNYEDFKLTGGSSGTLIVGDLNTDFELASGNYTDKYWEYNTEQEMLEAYAACRPGDAIAYINPDGGHTRMVTAEPVVIRDQQGLINAGYSYFLLTEQGSTTVDEIAMTYSTCKVNYKRTFASQAELWAVPVTCIELVTGEMETPECKINDGADGYMGMLTGVVEANYFLDSVDLVITDSKGNVVLSHKMFTTVDKRADIGNADGIIRNYNETFDLYAFATPLSKIQLEPGETYSYSLTANLGTYDSFVVKEDSFTYGQA